MQDSASTFHAGYTVATVLYVAYTISLWVRMRRAKQRVDERRARR